MIIHLSNYSFFSKLKNIPIFLVSLILLIASFGFAMMYSAAGGSLSPWLDKQLINFIIFFIAMIIISLIDLRFWYKIAYLIYFFVFILLVFVNLKGHTAMGATRWVNLGFVKLQPSELMKLSLVLALSKYFHNISSIKTNKIYYLIIPIILTIAPFLLILKQPDLGTGLILIIVSGIMFFIAGVNIRKFIVLFSILAAITPIAWGKMHQYQKQRIIVFLNPEIDPLGSGYNILQSKIAIGSGGFFGKGLIKGSQSQLDFLPEHQTDFVFTMICEETGFIGALIVIILYSLIIIYSFYIAICARSFFAKLTAFGISLILFLHASINMAMVMGLVPVVGVPLPLISYGRTMMMTMLISFGLLLNIKIHSNNINF